jgi:hypothetical protein
VQIATEPGHRLVAVTGHVKDISTTGLLLRTDRHLPAGIVRTLLNVTMPWGHMKAAVTPVDQRADTLRGTYEWLDPADAGELQKFCA